MKIKKTTKDASGDKKSEEHANIYQSRKTYRIRFTFIRRCKGYTVVKAIQATSSSGEKRKRSKGRGVTSGEKKGEKNEGCSKKRVPHRTGERNGDSAVFSGDSVEICGREEGWCSVGESCAEEEEEMAMGRPGEPEGNCGTERDISKEPNRSHKNEIDVEISFSNIKLRRADDIIDESSTCSIGSQCSGTVIFSEDSSGIINAGTSSIRTRACSRTLMHVRVSLILSI